MLRKGDYVELAVSVGSYPARSMGIVLDRGARQDGESFKVALWLGDKVLPVVEVAKEELRPVTLLIYRGAVVGSTTGQP